MCDLRASSVYLAVGEPGHARTGAGEAANVAREGEGGDERVLVGLFAMLCLLLL